MRQVRIMTDSTANVPAPFALERVIHDLVPVDRLVIGPAGPALAAHLGLGVVAVCTFVAPAC